MKDNYRTSNFNKTKEERPARPPEENTQTVAAKKGLIRAVNFVSVRRNPEIYAKVVGYVRNGDKVTILEKADGYYKIEAEEGPVHGYISSEFCCEV